LTEYDQTVSSDLKSTVFTPVFGVDRKIIVGCNTTDAEYFYFQANANDGLYQLTAEEPGFLPVIESLPGPLDMQDGISLWGLMARKLWYTFSRPTDGLNAISPSTPFLRESLIATDPPLSYIRFEYTGKALPLNLLAKSRDTFQGGTPANGSWNLLIRFQMQAK